MKSLVRCLLLVAWLTGLLPGGSPPPPEDPALDAPVRVVADTDLLRLTVGAERIVLRVGGKRAPHWRVTAPIPRTAPRPPGPLGPPGASRSASAQGGPSP